MDSPWRWNVFEYIVERISTVSVLLWIQTWAKHHSQRTVSRKWLDHSRWILFNNSQILFHWKYIFDRIPSAKSNHQPHQSHHDQYVWSAKAITTLGHRCSDCIHSLRSSRHHIWCGALRSNEKQVWFWANSSDWLMIDRKEAEMTWNYWNFNKTHFQKYFLINLILCPSLTLLIQVSAIFSNFKSSPSIFGHFLCFNITDFQIGRKNQFFVFFHFYEFLWILFVFIYSHAFSVDSPLRWPISILVKHLPLIWSINRLFVACMTVLEKRCRSGTIQMKLTKPMTRRRCDTEWWINQMAMGPRLKC